VASEYLVSALVRQAEKSSRFSEGKSLLCQGQDPIATSEGVAMIAALLDELLARRTVADRPADLTEGLAWVRAASGRAPHSDPRLPLLG
jgi:hypothetical protein